MKSNSIILQGLSFEEFFEKFKNCNIHWINEIINQNFKNQEDPLLTRKEAAGYLKINLSTLWQWQKSGKITALSIGNRIYFRKSSIDKSLIKIN